MDVVLQSTQSLTDEELLLRYGAGEAEAARLITARMVPIAFSHALRLLGGDRAEAEDVAQEAMMRLWRVAPEWRRGEAKVTTWLYRVVANLAIDRLRKGYLGAAGLDEIAEPLDEAPSALEIIENDQRLDALHRALASLPERQREAVILRHIEGLSNGEIAEIMQIGLEAVESLTARGKKSLAAKLSGQRERLGYYGG